MMKKITKSFVIGFASVLAFGAVSTYIGKYASRSIIKAVAAEQAGEFPGATNVYYDKFGAGEYTTDHIDWVMASNSIKMTQLKANSGTNVNASYTSSARVYKGHALHFAASNGYKILKIEIKYTGSYSGNSMTAGVSISDGIVVNDSTTVDRTWANGSAGTHIIKSTNATGLDDIYIQNVATSSNTQLRWDANGVTVYYIKPSASGTINSVVIKNESGNESNVTLNSGYLGNKYVQLSAVVDYTGPVDTTVLWESENNEIASVSQNGLVCIKANAPSGVTISASCGGKSDDIVIFANNLESEIIKEDFDFTNLGNSNYAPLDSSAIANFSSNNAIIKTYSENTSNYAGYYSNDNIFKGYSTKTMDIDVGTSKILKFVKIEAVEPYLASAANLTVTSGCRRYYDGVNLIIDCESLDTFKLDFTFNATVWISSIQVGYVSNSDPLGEEKEVINSTKTLAQLGFDYTKGSTEYTNLSDAVACDSEAYTLPKNANANLSLMGLNAEYWSSVVLSGSATTASKIYGTGTLRLYQKDALTFTSTKKIIKFEYECNNDKTAKDNGYTLDGDVDGTFSGTSSDTIDIEGGTYTFKISANNNQIQFTKMIFTFEEMGYVTTGKYSFSNVKLNFGSIIDGMTLMDLEDKNANISKYGVALARASILSTNKTNIKDAFEANANYVINSEKVFDWDTVAWGDEKGTTAGTDYIVFSANLNIPNNANGVADNEYLTMEFIAVGYVVVNDEYIYLTETEPTSVKSLANKYKNNADSLGLSENVVNALTALGKVL